MPLMGSIYVGTTGLQTSQNALNTTGHNITNADTAGYVRQQTMLGDKDYNTISITAGVVSNKQLGLGVTYQQIRQVRDVFLDQTYREESGRLAFYELQYDTTSEIEDLLGELDGASFENSINDLWVSVQELGKDPSSSVVQSMFMQKAYAFMTDAQAVYKGLSNYQDNLNQSIKLTIDDINEMGGRIKELNDAIRKIESAGVEKANDLKDERNQLLDKLSSLANIQYYDDAMGNVLVKLEGHSFVEADRVNDVAYQIDETTSFYDVFWKDDAKFVLDNHGERVYNTEGALVFNLEQEISSALDTDLGKLKSMVIARGDHRATYADLEDHYDADGNLISSAEDNYHAVSNSVLMSAQAEFDRLIHATVTAINGALEQAYQKAGSGDYMSDGNGHALQIFHRKVSDVDVKEDLEKTETLFSIDNLQINSELMQTPSKLGFIRPDGSVDYDTTTLLKDAFENADYPLNPTANTKLTINSFYSAFVAQIANECAVFKSFRDNEQLTLDSTENARQQIIGVSTDEELSNMIRYQNAYNASSRYINVVSEMLEHLLNSLG
jgi:flagellar hook-associated protein 1 FlgK